MAKQHSLKVLASLRWLFMLVWAFIVIMLTILPGHIPPVSVLSRWMGGTELGGVIGHLFLFSLLTMLVAQALAQWVRWRQALLLATLAVLMLGTTTELFQWFVAGRMSTLTDMLANWLAAFSAAFLLSYAR